MTTDSTTQPLNTSTITVMSHVTSITVTANKLSKLATPGEPPTLYLNFEVQGKSQEPCILAGAEELGLILSAEDARILGSALLAMAE